MHNTHLLVTRLASLCDNAVPIMLYDTVLNNVLSSDMKALCCEMSASSLYYIE